MTESYPSPTGEPADLTVDPEGRPLALPEFGTIEEMDPESAGAQQEEAEDGAGEEIAVPAAHRPRFAPPCDSTTGPYRRIVSQPGFAYLSARVFLPGRPDVRETQGTKDTAHVYAGGWGGPRSASARPGSGDALDAGFQHSPTKDDWALFVRAEHIRDAKANPLRFLPGREVFLEMFVSADDEVTARATGIVTTGNTETVVVTLPLRSNSGWRRTGEGVLLKRITSIAQDPQDLDTGSLLRGVRWSACRIGASAQQNEPWTAQHTADRCTFRPGKVTVEFVDSAEETNTIIL